MPGPARLITLNLGSQTIGVAEFRLVHGGLVLVNYRLREMPLDPQTGQRREAHVALEEGAAVLREMQISRRPVNYALPAQSVFARFVKLPPVGKEKLDKIISFEAQQNVPFPLDEVVWDYQLVGGGLGEQIQVVLVAIKIDLLEQTNAAVEGTGLQTSVVDLAPMALYNAFRYSYPEVADCSLLLDIGARTTNILFIESGRIFLRSIPLGGGAITAAIAREFNESSAAAETRKKRDGFVGLGGANAEPADPNVARVSKIARSTMTRLHAELMRSITHYRAQQQGNRPARIFLCGGGAGMPYMREFFHEKFQVPIEFFNPLQNVTVAESAPTQDVARSAHLLGELVGFRSSKRAKPSAYIAATSQHAWTRFATTATRFILRSRFNGTINLGHLRSHTARERRLLRRSCASHWKLLSLAVYSRFELQKRNRLFIRSHNKATSVLTLCGHDPKLPTLVIRT